MRTRIDGDIWLGRKRSWGRIRGEREAVFIEAYMTSDVNAIRGWVKTAISMVRGAVTQKDARSGPKIHFVSIVRTKVGITLTPEYTQKR